MRQQFSSRQFVAAKRSQLVPNVPTITEAGIAGYGFRRTEPEFHKKWEALGTSVVGGTAAQFGELIKKESVRLGKVVKDAGVTLD